jgi:hypothetical protein
MSRSPLQVVAERFFGSLPPLVAKLQAEGALNSQSFVVPHWRFPNFKYGPNGPEVGSGSGVPRETRDWSKAAEEALSRAKSTTEYKELQAELAAAGKPGEPVRVGIVDSVASQFIAEFLERPEVGVDSIRETADLLELHVRGDPIPLGANIRLNGLVVTGAPIRLRHRDLSVTIRQTEAADVEGPVRAPWGFPGIAPDCIGEIRLTGRPYIDAQIQADRLENVLRLYTGAPVFSVGIEILSMPWGKSAGVSSSGFPRLAWRKVTIGENDQPGLTSFLDRFAEKLPSQFLPRTPSGENATYVAFERFGEALDGTGGFERSVTAAVMGLEALYLKAGGEQAELTYRLRIRVARCLAYVSRRPERVSEVVDFAYDVRSGYVHGGKISLKDRKQIERLYSSLQSFQVEIIDLLRVSLVAAFLRTLEKEEFVELIDEALIDPAKGSRLESMFAETKSLVGLPVGP